MNITTVCAAFALSVLYRTWRGLRRSKARSRRKERGLVVGVDVDGVLANQIEGVLPWLNAQQGVLLEYKDVTAWDLPVGSTDIKAAIVTSLEDEEYVLNMPVHANAAEAMRRMATANVVNVVTARGPQAAGWTQKWLERNGIVHDGLATFGDMEKSKHGADVLIDDYVGNCLEFLVNTKSGYAILVDQPWNRDRSPLERFAAERRFAVVADLGAAAIIVDSLRRARAGSVEEDVAEAALEVVSEEGVVGHRL